MIRTQFRSIFELMQRNAVDRECSGGWEGRTHKYDAQQCREQRAADYLGPGMGKLTVESVSMRSGMSTHTKFSVPGSAPLVRRKR